MIDRIDVRRVAPTAVGFEKDLYRLGGVEGPDAYAVETEFFSRVDDLGAKALARLMARDNLRGDAGMRSAWSRFLYSLLLRHPDDLSAITRELRNHWEQVKPALEAQYQQERRPTDPETLDDFVGDDPHLDRRIALLGVKDMIDEGRVGRFVNNMFWAVLDVSKSNLPLLSSDRPVLRTNGLDHANGQLVVPIGPRHVFVAARSPEIIAAIQGMPARDVVRRINREVVGQASRYVVATDRHQDAFVRRTFGVLGDRSLTAAIDGKSFRQ